MIENITTNKLQIKYYLYNALILLTINYMFISYNEYKFRQDY